MEKGESVSAILNGVDSHIIPEKTPEKAIIVSMVQAVVIYEKDHEK